MNISLSVLRARQTHTSFYSRVDSEKKGKNIELNEEQHNFDGKF